MMLRHISRFIAGLVISSAALCAPGTVDFPEKESESYIMEGGYRVVNTVGFAARNFFYVFRNEERVWKSPPVGIYFSVSGGPENIDVDGDGVDDIVWHGGQPHFYCGNFGIIIALGNKTNNYLIHYDSSEGLMEFSEIPQPSLMPKITKIVQELACPSDSEDVALMIARKNFTVITPASDKYPELKRLYKQAMKLYASRKIAKAAELLDTFFFEYDYREVDAGNHRPEYTEILNDYGFFLQQLGEKRVFSEVQAMEILSYVVLRDPSRAVAYLNLADAQYAVPAHRKEAVTNYRIYRDLMIRSGKQKTIPERVFKRAQ